MLTTIIALGVRAETGRDFDIEDPAAILTLTESTGETSYSAFSAWQRWGTWGLNFIVPGLGSFLIMKDIFGGTFQIATCVSSYTMLLVGVLTWDHSTGGIANFLPATLLIGYGALFYTNVIFNIVRSAMYKRNVQTVFTANDWNIAVIPGDGGIEKVSLIRTIRY